MITSNHTLIYSDATSMRAVLRLLNHVQRNSRPTEAYKDEDELQTSKE
jgi:hypothetical protein